jgi:itaconate CoA-transferase
LRPDRRRPAAHHPQLRARDRWRTIGTEHARVAALLPPATFADVEARMGDVPALGEHTTAPLMEAGLHPDVAADAITRGVALQADALQPVSIR